MPEHRTSAWAAVPHPCRAATPSRTSAPLEASTASRGMPAPAARAGGRARTCGRRPRRGRRAARRPAISTSTTPPAGHRWRARRRAIRDGLRRRGAAATRGHAPVRLATAAVRYPAQRRATTAWTPSRPVASSSPRRGGPGRAAPAPAPTAARAGAGPGPTDRRASPSTGTRSHAPSSHGGAAVAGTIAGAEALEREAGDEAQAVDLGLGARGRRPAAAASRVELVAERRCRSARAAACARRGRARVTDPRPGQRVTGGGDHQAVLVEQRLADEVGVGDRAG